MTEPDEDENASNGGARSGSNTVFRDVDRCSGFSPTEEIRSAASVDLDDDTQGNGAECEGDQDPEIEQRDTEET